MFWTQRANEFSEIIKAYGNGLLSIEDIPAYEFSGELKNALSGYAKNHMKHWRKQKEAAAPAQVA